MVSDEEGVVELLVEELDEVGSADGRHLEGELLQLQGHVLDLLYWWLLVDEILDFVGELEGLVEILPVVGQPHLGIQNTFEVDGETIEGSGWYILEGMLQKTLLLELLKQGRVHVEVNRRVVLREVHLILPEDLLLYGNRVQDELHVGVTLEVTQIANEQPPGHFP